jgi:hypothetical protein
MCREPKVRMSRFLLCSTISLALSACVLVPVDSRTGLPLNMPPAAAPNQVTVVNPPAPAAPASTLLTARLYPLNETAQRAGMLNATIVDHHSGRGTITLGYLGDTLQGEATRVAGNARKGIANAAGARGVSAQCEYQLSGAGMGTGSCGFSDGALYRLHFGG